MSGASMLVAVAALSGLGTVSALALIRGGRGATFPRAGLRRAETIVAVGARAKQGSTR